MKNRQSLKNRFRGTKTILSFLFFCFICRNLLLSQGMVAINTTGSTPDTSAALDISSSDKGLLIPRIALTGSADTSTISSPATSLLIYNTASTSNVTPGFYYYDGSQWQRVITGNTIATTDNQDLSLSGDTLSLTNDTTTVDLSGYSANIYTTDDSLTSNRNINTSGNELRFSGEGNVLVDGVLGSIADDRLRITSGTRETFDDSQGASIDLHSNNSFGRAGRLDLVGGSSASGNNSAVTVWTNDGSTFGGQNQRFTITGNGNVGVGIINPSSLLDINGRTTTNNLTIDSLSAASNLATTDNLLFVNSSGIVRMITLSDLVDEIRAYTPYPSGSRFCSGDKPTEIVDVTNSTTGKTWMDRNLGASRAATSSTDSESYGYLYQWGRFSDEHQCRNSSVTNTNSNSDSPGHSNFISEIISPNDWRVPQNDNLWQGTNGVNNPCPSGYRIPTEAELNAERLSWASNNSAGAFGSPLKFALAGYRYQDGTLFNVGSAGFYWSSTVDGTDSAFLRFTSSGGFVNDNLRSRAFSVRCIKN